VRFFFLPSSFPPSFFILFYSLRFYFILYSRPFLFCNCSASSACARTRRV
jgi:hypothetical protein